MCLGSRDVRKSYGKYFKGKRHRSKVNGANAENSEYFNTRSVTEKNVQVFREEITNLEIDGIEIERELKGGKARGGGGHIRFEARRTFI